MNTPRVGGAFAEILRQNQARFNALFAVAQMNAPALDGAAFLAHLSTHVAPLVEAIHEEDQTRSHAAATALYEISLELFAKNLLGEAPRSTLVPLAWRQLFPALTKFLSKRVLGALCNACVQFEGTPGARGEAWVEAMGIFATTGKLGSDDGDDFLRAAQIVAWRCGLAQLRESALKTARELAVTNETLARTALGASDVSTPTLKIIAHYENDVWWLPHKPRGDQVTIQKIVGAFRGLESDSISGAVFLQPPRVTFHNGNFYAADEENVWLFFADAFGASFHRVGSLNEFSGDATTPPFSNALGDGVEVPQLAQPSSIARGARSVAVTLPHSHAIYLVA